MLFNIAMSANYGMSPSYDSEYSCPMSTYVSGTNRSSYKLTISSSLLYRTMRCIGERGHHFTDFTALDLKVYSKKMIYFSAVINWWTNSRLYSLFLSNRNQLFGFLGLLTKSIFRSLAAFSAFALTLTWVVLPCCRPPSFASNLWKTIGTFLTWP